MNIEFQGTLSSSENKGISEKEKSTAGLYFKNSQLNINGTIESIANEGYITSIQSVSSNISLMEGASLLLNGNHGAGVMSLAEGSKLIILNGTLMACNNTLRKRVIKVDTSEMIVNGNIVFINNSKSPLIGYIAKILLNGQIEFSMNAGVLYALRSDLDINGNSTFYRNNVADGYKEGAVAIQQSTLNLSGYYMFLENRYENADGGGAIYAILTSVVRFSGIGKFENNSAKSGGAIFLDQMFRLELYNETELRFVNNSAIKGGAIFIGTSVEHVQCVNDLNTCLFGPINSGNLNASLIFQHNTAYPGGSVMHVNFDIINDSEITYQALKDLEETLKIASGKSVPTLASDSYWFCFCENDSRKGCARNDPPLDIIISNQGKTIFCNGKSTQILWEY